VLELTPTAWFAEVKSLLTEILEQSREGRGELEPKLASFLREQLPEIMRLLNESKPEDCKPAAEGLTHPARITEPAINFILRVAEHFFEQMGTVSYQARTHFASFEEIERQTQGRVKVITVQETGDRLLQISLDHALTSWYTADSSTSSDGVQREMQSSDRSATPEQPGAQLMVSIKLPKIESVVLKGGTARFVLKALVGAPPARVLPECPLNDVDALVQQDNDVALKHALELGADREGVEPVKDVTDPGHLRTRDITMNSCVLTHSGLLFTPEAYSHARDGRVAPLLGDKGLFGKEYMQCPDGVMLVMPRVLSRMVKFLAEGKGEFFELPKRNFQLDIGLHVLALAKKFETKENAPALFTNLYDLLSQIEQVKSGERNLFDVLDRIHTEHPYFEVNGGKLRSVGVTKWLARKLDRFIVRSFRFLEDIPRPNTITLKEGDEAYVRIELRNVEPMSQDYFAEQKRAFHKRSEERTRLWREANPDEL
jgi:hypothetical protein